MIWKVDNYIPVDGFQADNIDDADQYDYLCYSHRNFVLLSVIKILLIVYFVNIYLQQK